MHYLICEDRWHYNYYLNGDSVIGDKTYKKMFRRGTLTNVYWGNPEYPDDCGTDFTYNELYALIRSADRRMYYRSVDIWNPSESEALLYDFNLDVGDTLATTEFNPEGPYPRTVVAIDSINTPNGYLQVFTLDSWGGPQTLIEGVGTDWGVFVVLYQPFDCGFDLLCYSLSDSTYYPEPAEGNCYLTLGLDRNPDEVEFALHPNPADDEVLIRSRQEASTIHVYSSTGKRVHSEHSHSSETHINVQDWPAGLYIIEVITSDGPGVKKFVVE